MGLVDSDRRPHAPGPRKLGQRIAVTVTEPISIYPSHPDKRIHPTASSSTFSSVTLPEQGGRLPSDILPGANMGLLSVDSPALLNSAERASVPEHGHHGDDRTITVSTGGVVPTRSLIMIDGCRRRVRWRSSARMAMMGRLRASEGQRDESVRAG